MIKKIAAVAIAYDKPDANGDVIKKGAIKVSKKIKENLIEQQNKLIIEQHVKET